MWWAETTKLLEFCKLIHQKVTTIWKSAIESQSYQLRIIREIISLNLESPISPKIIPKQRIWQTFYWWLTSKTRSSATVLWADWRGRCWKQKTFHLPWLSDRFGCVLIGWSEWNVHFSGYSWRKIRKTFGPAYLEKPIIWGRKRIGRRGVPIKSDWDKLWKFWWWEHRDNWGRLRKAFINFQGGFYELMAVFFQF